MLNTSAPERAAVSEHAPASPLTAGPAPPNDTRGLYAILLLALLLRLPGIERPIVGNFATKAAVYGMIARNLAEGRAPFFEPTLDLLKNGRRSLHLLELPLPAYLTAGLWKAFGGNLDVWGRATAIGWSLLGVLLLYRLLARWHGQRVAVVGAAVLALSPVGIVYGQAFQLEASLVPLSLGMFLGLELWLHGGRARHLWAAAGCGACLFVTKIFMLYLLLPLAVQLWQGRHRLRFHSNPTRKRGPMPEDDVPRLRVGFVLSAAALAIVPAMLWYGYAYFAAQGHFGLDVDRLYYSVHDSAGVHQVPHPLLGQAVFYKRLIDDLAGIVLTPVGFGLLLLGLVQFHISPTRERGTLPRSRVGLGTGESREGDSRHILIAAWLLATVALIVVLPRKFHEMNYYWVGMLPVFCAIAGQGGAAVWKRLSLRPVGLSLLAVVWLICSLRFAVTPAFVTPQEDAAVVAAGAALRQVSHPEERIVTLHGSTLDLLYYCDRPGWILDPSRPSQISDYRRQGARYFVIADLRQLARFPALASALDHDSLAAEGPDYRVYRLAK